MQLSTFERQVKIQELIQQNHRVTVADICEIFGVSEATARRDLETLAEEGKIRRVHGGAIIGHQAPPEPPILQRSADQSDQKFVIGKAAAKLVEDGETIYLGSGSTILEMSRNLRDRHGLTIITNSLPIINLLADMKDFTLINLGGLFRHTELSFIGHITEQALGEVRADKVFLSTRAIDIGEGMTNAYLPETMTDRAILKIGRQIIILADHTKCGRISTAFMAPCSDIDILVTDNQTPKDFIEAMEALGARVIVA
jgi:DeoR family transcriptional regulator of aga operon